MTIRQSLFVYCLLAGLSGCSSYSSKKETTSTPSTESNSEIDRIRQANSQQKRTAYKGFEINLVATLRLPQIESPDEATKVKGDLELVELSKTNVSNGHICIDTHVHFSSGQNTIPKDQWSAAIQVDGVDVQTKGQIYSSSRVRLWPASVEGNSFISICTVKKFLMTLDVVFLLKNSSNEIITKFQWHNPWPAPPTDEDIKN